jgi:hypothetical protein
MMDFELLIIVASEPAFAAAAGEFGAGGMTAALFDPGMTVAARPLTFAGFCETITRSDFELPITVPTDADAVGGFGGKTMPSFELYMMVLPEPLPLASGGMNTGPNLGLLMSASSDPEALAVTVARAAITSSNGVRGVSKGLLSKFGIVSGSPERGSVPSEKA